VPVTKSPPGRKGKTVSEDIPKLRDEIAMIDQAMVELLERRFKLAETVGRIKAKLGRPVVVREVEKNVIARARNAAELCGVSPEMMEAIFMSIIHGSVERQHRVGVSMGISKSARILIVGAAGAMGGWLRRFFENIGHTSEGVDSAWEGLPPHEERFSRLDDVPDLAAFDAVFISVPLDKTAEALEEMVARGLKAPLFEIASIKNHLEKPLDELRRKGTPTISLHPMFGPDKNPYGPLTIVHAAFGNEKGERQQVLDLLAHPYLDLVSLPFERHDRTMGWLLGLAHLTGMLFAEALSHSGLDPRELGRAASTTFSRQVATAHSVLSEDPALYFSIQRLNPFRGEIYAALNAALGELTGAVERDDAEQFASFLSRAADALPEQDDR